LQRIPFQPERKLKGRDEKELLEMTQAANSKTHYPKTPSQLQLSKTAEDFLKDHPSAFKTLEAKVKEQRRLAGASKSRKTTTDS